MTVTFEPKDDPILPEQLADQPALHSVLFIGRDQGLKLIAVDRV